MPLSPQRPDPRVCAYWWLILERWKSHCAKGQVLQEPDDPAGPCLLSCLSGLLGGLLLFAPGHAQSPPFNDKPRPGGGDLATGPSRCPLVPSPGQMLFCGWPCRPREPGVGRTGTQRNPGSLRKRQEKQPRAAQALTSAPLQTPARLMYPPALTWTRGEPTSLSSLGGREAAPSLSISVCGTCNNKFSRAELSGMF